MMTAIQPSYEELLAKCTAHEHEISYLKQQIEWFRRQLFGQKSEREVPAHPTQLVLCSWVLRSGLALQPLYKEMEKAILNNRNVFVDESPVDMQIKGKGCTTQAYMWVLCGDEQAPYRLYRFFKNRKHENAEELLKGYTGLLHSDKYGAYVKLAEKKQVTWMPCFAHIRRLFYEAESGDPKFRDWVLRQIRYLFMFERVAWNRPPEERLRIRQEKEIPLLDKLIDGIQKMLLEGKLLPKSKLRQAIGYFISLIPYLKKLHKASLCAFR